MRNTTGEYHFTFHGNLFEASQMVRGASGEFIWSPYNRMIRLMGRDSGKEDNRKFEYTESLIGNDTLGRADRLLLDRLPVSSQVHAASCIHHEPIKYRLISSDARS